MHAVTHLLLTVRLKLLSMRQSNLSFLQRVQTVYGSWTTSQRSYSH